MVWMEAEEENFNLVDERMAMRIIQNKEENHLDEVKWLFGKSNKIVIVSPFLSKDAIQELGKILHAKISDVTMVTTLKPFDVDQFSKVKALVELNMLKKLRGYNLSIRIDNDLHGKVYIGKKDNQYVGCIITSANFTHKGMEQNHEWGVFLDDQDKIRQIHEQILGDAVMVVNDVDLQRMVEYMDEHPEVNVEQPTIEANFVGMLKPILVSKRPPVTYWLKPLGRDHKPVPNSTFYGDVKHQITFSKRGRPTGIKEGDILIAYSIGTMQLISIFVAGNNSDRGELTNFIQPGDDKWPYYIWCENKTPQYGSYWSKMGLTLHSLREQFLREQPTSTVLPSGNKMNALQWGSDHVRATVEFGEFVVEKLLERMKSI